MTVTLEEVHFQGAAFGESGGGIRSEVNSICSSATVDSPFPQKLFKAKAATAANAGLGHAHLYNGESCCRSKKFDSAVQPSTNLSDVETVGRSRRVFDFRICPVGASAHQIRATRLTEAGESRAVEAVQRTALYFLASLHPVRLLGASRETQRVRGERQHRRRLPVGSGESGSRRFASD